MNNKTNDRIRLIREQQKAKAKRIKQQKAEAKANLIKNEKTKPTVK